MFIFNEGFHFHHISSLVDFLHQTLWIVGEGQVHQPISDAEILWNSRRCSRNLPIFFPQKPPLVGRIILSIFHFWFPSIDVRLQESRGAHGWKQNVESIETNRICLECLADRPHVALVNLGDALRGCKMLKKSTLGTFGCDFDQMPGISGMPFEDTLQISWGMKLPYKFPMKAKNYKSKNSEPGSPFVGHITGILAARPFKATILPTKKMLAMPYWQSCCGFSSAFLPYTDTAYSSKKNYIFTGGSRALLAAKSCIVGGKGFLFNRKVPWLPRPREMSSILWAVAKLAHVRNPPLRSIVLRRGNGKKKTTTSCCDAIPSIYGTRTYISYMNGWFSW